MNAMVTENYAMSYFLGQLEKIDTTEVGRYFASKPYIDETRIAVWGWSYGGYTTTFTICKIIKHASRM